jgi:hypothetical protein
MSVSLSNITGATIAAFTTPGYNVTADTPPDAFSKQWAILSTSGTQTGVDAHSGSKPFTITFSKVANFKYAPKVNANGFLNGATPRNVFRALCRKGMSPVAGQPANVGLMRVEFDLPAGADTAEPEEIKALISAMVGALSQVSSGLADTLITNVL